MSLNYDAIRKLKEVPHNLNAILAELENNSGTLKALKNSVNVTQNSREVTIGITEFTKGKDVLMVYKNSVYLEEGIDYEISADSLKITKKTGSWNESGVTMVFNFVVFKNVPEISGLDFYTKNEVDVKVNTKVGDLSGLNTTEKSNVVAAINENKTSILTLQSVDGKLTDLATTNKNNLVSAINEAFQFASNGKNAIANAFGSPLLATDSFPTMGTKIASETQEFANNLIAKGVSVSEAEKKMSILIDKVSDIKMLDTPIFNKRGFVWDKDIINLNRPSANSSPTRFICNRSKLLYGIYNGTQYQRFVVDLNDFSVSDRGVSGYIGQIMFQIPWSKTLDTDVQYAKSTQYDSTLHTFTIDEDKAPVQISSIGSPKSFVGCGDYIYSISGTNTSYSLYKIGLGETTFVKVSDLSTPPDSGITNKHSLVPDEENNCLYFLGNDNSGSGYSLIVWKYDIPSNTWSFLLRTMLPNHLPEKSNPYMPAVQSFIKSNSLYLFGSYRMLRLNLKTNIVEYYQHSYPNTHFVNNHEYVFSTDAVTAYSGISQIILK